MDTGARSKVNITQAGQLTFIKGQTLQWNPFIKSVSVLYFHWWNFSFILSSDCSLHYKRIVMLGRALLRK